jgi:hypothetical protein
MNVARVMVALLAVAGNFGIAAIDQNPSGDTLAGWLYVLGSVAVGLFIARWWAIVIALGWLAVAATTPPGHDDTQGTIIFLVGVLGAIGQAVFIVCGVATNRGFRALRRRRAAKSH